MPQVDPATRKRTKKPWFLIAGGILVLAAGGAYLAWRLVPTPAQSLMTADNLMEQRDFQGAYGVLQGAYSRALSKDDKAMLLSEMAACKSGTQDHAAAIGYYRQLNQLAPHNYSYLVEWGDEAYDNGYKEDAVRAYSEALDILKLGQPSRFSRADTVSMQTRLKELE